MCGEHTATLTEKPSISGSSPHVRGTQIPATGSPPAPRFIPACAGNTTIFCRCFAWQAVHPRMCGEHTSMYSPGTGMVGSSPHVRGTLIDEVFSHQNSRFIPACAGNTTPAALLPRIPPVHPRMCGEHVNRIICELRPAGSSPHVRGTLTGRYSGPVNLRFIPACAGNTAMRSPSARRWSVHPRMCGEHRHGPREPMPGAGSSPHVRGTLQFPGDMLIQHRFIPACAGNTSFVNHSDGEMSVHPRMCGEHETLTICGHHLIGSSPHVRGTPSTRWCIACPHRFIPACAGNTS